MLKPRLYIPIVLVLCVVAIMWPHFGKVWMHPNGFLLAIDADGLKNYFLFSSYLKFDSGLMLSGMNYPYGEHLFFTDSHPVYAWILNQLSGLIPVSDYGVGILNLTLLCSMPLSSLVIYGLLRQYELPPWYAGIAALCLLFLSPQWVRLSGHLSLSYVFVIPWFWYLSLRLDQSEQKTGWSLLMMLSALLLGGIHVYYLGIYLVFTLGWWMMKMLLDKGTWTSRLRRHLLILFVALGPALAFMLFTGLTDPVDDRPTSPYGFFVYHASLSSVFLPYFSSLTQIVSRVFHPDISWEGRAFVGSLSSLATLWLLWKTLWQRNQEERPMLVSSEKAIYFWIGILALLFSMCIPFKWGLQFITEWIEPLQQFRALGRFSWIFYYIIGVLTAFYLYQGFLMLKQKGKTLVASVLLAGCLCVWLSESLAHYLALGQIAIHPNSKLEPQSGPYQQHLTNSGYKLDDFQAILPLPLVSIRTDKLTFGDHLVGMNEAMKASYHTGLPIVTASISRPSFQHAHTSIQLISSEWIEKERLRDMDGRPLLLLTAKGVPLNAAELKLFDASRLIWEDEYITLSELPLTAFDDRIAATKNDFNVNKGSFDQQGQLLCDSLCDHVYFKDFDSEDSRQAFTGKGAAFYTKGPVVLFDSIWKGLSGELSFWLFIDPTYSGLPSMEYWSGDDANRLELAEKRALRSPDVINQWFRVSIQLNQHSYHRILLHGHDITIDNLLVRPMGTSVYITDGQKAVLFNNYPLEPERMDE